MMVMTAKVDIKKVLIALGAIAGLILLLVLVFGGNDAAPTAAPVSDNDSRLQFLQSQGWEVSASPVESGKVMIPQESSEMFERYNALQKSQGYDLSKLAGKTIMRYVYRIHNYPNATEPVYATILVYKNKIVGGDITNTAPGGTMQGIIRSDG